MKKEIALKTIFIKNAKKTKIKRQLSQFNKLRKLYCEIKLTN